MHPLDDVSLIDVSQPSPMYKRWITTTASRYSQNITVRQLSEGMDVTQRIIIQGTQRQSTFVRGHNGRKQINITPECLF
jgi:hypothetical protein